MLNFPLAKFKCWHCQNENQSNTWKFIKKHQFKKQIFYFWKCLSCNNNLYYFEDRHQKCYFVPKINIVLHHPEIPGNVGTIMRLAVAFDFDLHLIEPFGFIFCERWLKRSSANHFKLARFKKYYHFEDFLQKNNYPQLILTSSKGNQNLHDFDFTLFTKPLFIIFGCESKGLPSKIINKYPKYLLKIPLTKKVSSINLANAVAIFVYSIFSQYNFLNLI